MSDEPVAFRGVTMVWADPEHLSDAAGVLCRLIPRPYWWQHPWWWLLRRFGWTGPKPGGLVEIVSEPPPPPEGIDVVVCGRPARLIPLMMEPAP